MSCHNSFIIAFIYTFSVFYVCQPYFILKYLTKMSKTIVRNVQQHFTGNSDVFN